MLFAKISQNLYVINTVQVGAVVTSPLQERFLAIKFSGIIFYTLKILRTFVTGNCVMNSIVLQKYFGSTKSS